MRVMETSMKRFTKTYMGVSLLLAMFSGLSVHSAEPLSVETLNYDFELEDDFDKEMEVKSASDPLQRFNRPMDRFNRWFLKKVGTPIVKVYTKIPAKGRGCVGNFFANLKSPLHVVNLTLQTKFKKAGKELGRFALNSTVGLAGLIDVAESELEWTASKEDFGQTLGHYGLGSGPYVHLPFMGPTTVRDVLSRPFNWPFEIDRYFFPHNLGYNWAASGLNVVNGMPFLVNQVKSVEKDAIDPYTFIRDASLQMREAQVRQ
jgi:phospholipid-binding lipoprotein MlaA